MYKASGLIRYSFLIPIVILILILLIIAQRADVINSDVINSDVINSDVINSIDYEPSIYMIPMSEDTQRDIWMLCDQNNISFEMVLAIYQVEGIIDTQFESLKAEIEELAYIRDYWATQGIQDEVVFDLTLLSRQRGIEGCKVYIDGNDTYELDSYILKIAEYKYELEQSLYLPTEIAGVVIDL